MEKFSTELNILMRKIIKSSLKKKDQSSLCLRMLLFCWFLWNLQLMHVWFRIIRLMKFRKHSSLLVIRSFRIRQTGGYMREKMYVQTITAINNILK